MATNLDTIPIATEGTDGEVVGTVGGLVRRLKSAAWTETRRKGRNSVSGSSYTLVLADAGKLVVHSHTAPSVTNIPTNATVPFKIGTRIGLRRGGAGTMVVTALSGVTLVAAGRPKLRVQGSVATLEKTDTNEWTLYGDTAA